MKTVAISYGWSEGPMQAQRLIATLKTEGFSVVQNLSKADIIIAHSGGCYMLPSEGQASIVMMVGLPYWPDRHPIKSLFKKVGSETKNMWWVKKTICNMYYFFTRPRQWYRMYRAWKKVSLPLSSSYASVISIRNKDDHFLHPIESEVLSKRHGWKSVLLDGTHDDIWLHPEKYVRVLKDSLNKQ